MKTWIKFCAQTNAEDALASYAAGADAVGFVFAESKRRVTPLEVKRIIAQLPPTGEKIGVFANEPVSSIAAIVLETGLTGVQLQGEEPAEQVRELRTLLPANTTITKTIRASEAQLQLSELSRKNTMPADAILIDSGSKQERGGTGRTFDWAQMKPAITELQKSARVIIAGGLRPENAEQAVRFFRPYGVDVATGVESAPGKKDVERMRRFVAAVRKADAEATGNP